MNFFQKLFSQPKQDTELEASSAAGEQPINEKPTIIMTKIYQLSSGLHVGKLSDVGQVRERNEDTLYTIETLTRYDYGEEPFGIFIVADGMGGHEMGDVASSVAARTTASVLLKEIYLPSLATANHQSENRPINEILISAVEEANIQVQEAAPEGGTTLTAALLMGNNAYIAHVGDTRAYLFNEQGLKQITEDHSLAQRLKAAGQGTPEQIAQIENVLYRAIGQGGPVEADTHVQHLPPGNSLLLCSDGLWKGIDDDDLIRETLNEAATPQEACEKLVRIANERGGEDNITVIIISMGLDS
jgi:serine/threonine protein phosphatase PrpC